MNNERKEDKKDYRKTFEDEYQKIETTKIESEKPKKKTI